MNNDLTNHDYWEKVWQSSSSLPTIPNPSQFGWKDATKRSLTELFSHWLYSARQNEALLEVGCANSYWLPYFAIEHGLTVSGIDYAEYGCYTSRHILSQVGVSGNVICADFFHPPTSLKGQFDYLISFGVVEHFTNTVRCLEAFRHFLKPGGTIFTLIPNLTGVLGFLQHQLDPAVYARHVIMDEINLTKAHQGAGFQIINSGQVGTMGFGILNLNETPGGTASYWGRKVILATLQRMAWPVWMLEHYQTTQLPIVPPYFYCIGKLQ